MTQSRQDIIKGLIEVADAAGRTGIGLAARSTAVAMSKGKVVVCALVGWEGRGPLSIITLSAQEALSSLRGITLFCEDGTPREIRDKAFQLADAGLTILQEKVKADEGAVITVTQIPGEFVSRGKVR